MSDESIPTFISTPQGDIDASKTEVPESRAFRNAWVLEGETIVVDMDMAKDIARDTIRREREPLLQQLDVEYLRLSETGVTANAVVDSKQMLRDAPADPRIDAAQDPEALEEAMNAIVAEMKDAV